MPLDAQLLTVSFRLCRNHTRYRYPCALTTTISCPHWVDELCCECRSMEISPEYTNAISTAIVYLP